MTAIAFKPTEQVSPDPEICAGCYDRGRPNVIAPFEPYLVLMGAGRTFNCCAGCWDKLFREVSR